MRTTWLAIALAACGNGKQSAADWSSRPLETVSGKVGHGDAVLAFAIQIPRGLVPAPHATDGVTLGYETSPRDFKAPSVTIGYDAIPPKTMDKAMVASMPDDTTEIVGRDFIDFGYMVTTRAKTGKYWRVNVYKLVDTDGVDCMAQQAIDDVELGDATRALLEKICSSLAILPSDR